MTLEAETERTPTRRKPDVAQAPSTAATGTPVFERLHALIGKGYTADLGTSERNDVVVLRHIGRAPDLILRGDGTVQGFDGRRPWYKRHVDPPAPIAPDGDAEHLRFLLFLNSIPEARFWDRTRAWRKKYVYFPAALVVVWGVCLALTAMIVDL